MSGERTSRRSGRPSRTRLRRIAAAWGPPALWAALVLGFSGERFGADETAGWIGAIVEALLPGLQASGRAALHAAARKGAHVFEYAVLAALVFRALRLSGPRASRAWPPALLTLVLAGGLALLDETRQAELPGRSGRAADVALDLAGAGAGLLATALWMRRSPAPRGPAARAEDAEGAAH